MIILFVDRQGTWEGTIQTPPVHFVLPSSGTPRRVRAAPASLSRGRWYMICILQASARSMLQNNLKAKRKVPDGEASGATDAMTTTSNPLLNAAKRAKREAKAGASNKRKLLNAEEQPGGLLIVRAPPATTNAPASTKPPSKKFKSSQPQPPSKSQPLPFTSKPSSKSSFLPSSYPISRHDTPDADPALDDAVRAMQDETAELRRSSRGPAHALDDHDSSGLHPKYRFPGATVNGVAVTTKGSGSGTSTGKRRETIVDMSAPLPPEGDETPQIQRNKRLRAGAMAELVAGNSNGSMSMDAKTPPNGSLSTGSGTGSGHRRKSSVGGRGKRISSCFQSTGVMSHPHNAVSDASFYKHIDADLPDAERVRQLLIWCSARAASTPGPTPLPVLSEKAAHTLRAAQDDVIRKLAERHVDLSLFGGSNQESEGEKKENAQNVTNRAWEGVYGGHIKSAMEEEEAWKKVGYAYDTYARRVRTSLEKRRAALLLRTTTTATTATPPLEEVGAAGPSIPSAKAQGKQRATHSKFELHEHELPPPFQAGVRMARTVVARTRRRRPNPDPAPPSTSTPGAGPSTRKGAADPNSRWLPTAAAEHASYDLDVDMLPPEAGSAVEAEAEAEREAGDALLLRSRVGELEFKLDHLYVLMSQARTTAEVLRLALDRRFEVLGRALDVRSEGPNVGGEGDIMGRYVRTGTSGGDARRRQAEEALQLLRAMARVDAARPPAQVGDAARRAMREVQRVGESRAGVVGERRLTGVPPPGAGVTPRKMPGTPRRGTTPSRDRERDRDR
ncbi:hypothetical protein D9615_009065 [Tricholomella constricta]|uniref:Kinetochore protein mis13 n=1 Tax=Tricholomella constricta TaxID=117010 RepID=A0A8H5LYR7_9AGAR|nr:hypothetical protein D9615_009065 [Tricholomella constricta]